MVRFVEKKKGKKQRRSGDCGSACCCLGGREGSSVRTLSSFVCLKSFLLHSSGNNVIVREIRMKPISTCVISLSGRGPIYPANESLRAAQSRKSVFNCTTRTSHSQEVNTMDKARVGIGTSHRYVSGIYDNLDPT